MAKNRGTPAPMPALTPPPYTKRSSMSPEQSDHRAGSRFYDPQAYDMPDQAVGGKLAPPPPVHQWNNGSYDPSTGRAARVAGGAPKGAGQIPNAGRTTQGAPAKASRPGRW